MKPIKNKIFNQANNVKIQFQSGILEMSYLVRYQIWNQIDRQIEDQIKLINLKFFIEIEDLKVNYNVQPHVRLYL